MCGWFSGAGGGFSRDEPDRRLEGRGKARSPAERGRERGMGGEGDLFTNLRVLALVVGGVD